MKQSTKSKKVIGGIAVGLALLLTIGLGGGLLHYFNAREDIPIAELPSDNPSDFPETGDTVIATPTEQRGIRLTTKAYTTERGTTAQLITATILPEDTSDKTINWEIDFIDPLDSWAAGKKVKDFVTMSENEASVSVECNQAFGAPIKITATAQANKDVSAECTLDYIKRITDITFSVKLDNSAYTGNTINFSDDLNALETYRITYSPVYSVYTIDDTFTAQANVDITQTFLDNLIEYAKTVDETFEEKYYLSQGYNPGSTDYIQGNFYDLLNTMITISKHSGSQINFGDENSKTDVVEWNKFVRLLKGFANEETFNSEFLKFNVTYTGKNSTFSDYISYKIGTIKANVLPESITFDKDNIVF